MTFTIWTRIRYQREELRSAIDTMEMAWMVIAPHCWLSLATPENPTQDPLWPSLHVKAESIG